MSDITVESILKDFDQICKEKEKTNPEEANRIRGLVAEAMIDANNGVMWQFNPDRTISKIQTRRSNK